MAVELDLARLACGGRGRRDGGRVGRIASEVVVEVVPAEGPRRSIARDISGT